MVRKKTVPTTPTSEEKPDPTPPEAAESGNSSEEDGISTASSPTSSSESEVQLQPSEFAREGRQTICTVCGTEARLDFDQQLFCPNAHNHPPLATSEASK